MLFTTNEKTIYLIDFHYSDNCDFDFDSVVRLSYDPSAQVRSMVASALINENDKRQLNVLSRLIKDKNAFVRTEAYDSISCFPSYEVAELLEKSIMTETNDLAKSYAIMSWAEICQSLETSGDKQIELLKSIKKKGVGNYSAIACIYAYHLTGKSDEAIELFKFLSNDNYRIRITALTTISECIDDLDKQTVKKHIESLLKTETAYSVRHKAISVLKDLGI